MTEQDSVYNLSFSRPEMPNIRETKNKDYVLYGEDNLYPNKLIEYRDISSLHNAILSTKSLMVAGEDILFDGKLTSEFLMSPEIQKFYENPGNAGDLKDLTAKISADYILYGAFSLEIIWAKNYKSIAEINYLDTGLIRSGKDDEGIVKEYWYSEDWSKLREYPAVSIPVFDKNTKEPRQIVYAGNFQPGLKFYGRPSYASVLSWVAVDGLISEFHLSNISNGFNPSMTLKFFKKPSSPEEQENIVRSIKQQFGGNKNTGKVMIFFSDGKELAPEVLPVSVSNLDKQFSVIADQVVQQIVAGHKVTSPMLLGIATPGKLGYSSELESSFKIFNRIVIVPDQRVIEKTLNMLSSINGITEKISIKPLNPLL
jgi:hypothetical protein